MPINPQARGNPNAGNIEQFVGGINKAAEGIREQSQPMRQAQAQAALRQFIGQQEDTEQEKRMKQVQDFIDQNASHGRKVSASAGKENFSAVQNEPNLILQNGKQMANEANLVNKALAPRLKPFEDQLTASENTINYLNAGNNVSDKLALLNEARLALAGSGGRAFGAVMAQLSGDPSLSGDAAKAMNWLNNSQNVTMQPAQRNAIREGILGRIAPIQTQYQSLKKQLTPMAQQLAPTHMSMGTVDNIVAPLTGPLEDSMQRLNKMNTEYMQQKTQGGNPQVSNPAQFNSQPTNLEKLGSWLGIGGKRAAPQQPQQSNPQMAPQGQPQGQPSGNSGQMRVKHKSSGQTGTIPSNEFDPNVYEQVQ